MKKLFFVGATLAFAGLAIAPANAQTQSTTTTSTSTGYIQSSKIIGSKIRSADGSEVGVIKDVVLDRSTGCMAYTVLETSGGSNVASSGGSRSSSTTTTRKTVAMPYTAFQATSDPTVYTTTIQRERIYNAPVYDYNRVEEYSRPEYIGGVYSYYGVQPSVGINVNVGATGRGVTTQSGSAALTNATPAPAASMTPLATATVAPAASPSPSAKAAASPSATARPSATAATSPTPTGTALPKPTSSPVAAATATAKPTASAASTTSSPASASSRTSGSASTPAAASKEANASKGTKSDESDDSAASKKGYKKADKTKGKADSDEPSASPEPSEP